MVRTSWWGQHHATGHTYTFIYACKHAASVSTMCIDSVAMPITFRGFVAGAMSLQVTENLVKTFVAVSVER
jgi:hypothetical protein